MGDGRQLWSARDLARQFCTAPPSQWHSLGSRQTTRLRCDLCTDLRGKNASALQIGARQLGTGWQPSGLATCVPVDRWSPLAWQSVDCSTLDAHEPFTRYSHASPGSALCYALGRGAAAALPRLGSIQLDGLVWGLSCSLPPKPNLPHFLPSVNFGVNL